MSLSSAEIRQKFLDFFESKQHKIVPSVPIVVKNDPTLMFINAGMNPFKDYFLGNAVPEFPRVADTQKCLRVSGKHNDLEEVGVDTYHHTLFEMLGNWSFGDYFKEEAISWAWELLTEVYGIDKDRMYVTVFEGDVTESLERDEESASYWSKFVPAERILNGNKKDNFWEMGDTGPCGPCSEIHVDMRSDDERKKVSGATLVNADHPQVIEIWNLVFMQFNRKADGSLESLPATHVDTGMGFERLCMVLQGKTSSYDTDVFQPIIRKIEEISGQIYGTNAQVDIAMRVIADHLRTVSFAIADGQLPSNTGAGYVIRRILRRAVRYAFSVLEIKQPFIAQLLPVLVQQMGAFFPELKNQENLIAQVATEEELAFIRTLEQGLHRLDDALQQYPQGMLPGEVAFELYDTFGFPVDLTSLILREKGRSLDDDAFQREMQKQKERSRAAGKLEAGDWTILAEGFGDFVGYDHLEVAQTRVCRYRMVKDKKKSYYQIVLEKTPFYPEGGGQIGDAGFLQSGDQFIPVWNTKKENGLILHFTDVLPNTDRVDARVDREKRRKTAANHSVTHLLHFALREILGTHVEQKGSFVGPEYLRFDFSHFSKVSNEELAQIENRVNALIASQIDLDEQRSISMEDAQSQGAMALFGEKYGDQVRAIRFGDSIELCGGTHVCNTAFIGAFVITAESSVAAGIRRIEAISGEAVRQSYLKYRTQWDDLSTVINSNTPLQAIEHLKNELEAATSKLKQFEKEQNRKLVDELKAQILDHGSLKVLVAQTELDPAAIKDMAFSLKNQFPELFMVLASEQNGKALLSIAVGEDAQKTGLHAGNLIREWSKLVRGGGGGQAFFATAGGSYPQGISQLIIAAKAHIGL
jgi:alanyl-tRNA synthetase